MASEQFQKVKHMYPMISLDNTYNSLEVRDWNDRMLRILSKSDSNLFDGSGIHVSQNNGDSHVLHYYVQPKYDGLGLAVIYKNGIFDQAITRGSGVE